MKRAGAVVSVILGIALFCWPAIADPFNDADNRKTAAWIISAMGKLREANIRDLVAMKTMLARRYSLAEIDNTFGKLQACRTVEKYKTNPLPLVAAEHYSFMRFEASKYGDTDLHSCQSYTMIRRPL